MKVNGHGGYWLLYTPPPPTPNGYVGDPKLGTYLIAHNSEYEVVTEVDIRQTRTVGCGGWTEGLPRFRRVEHATLKVAEDEDLYPQVIGLTEGAEVPAIYLKRGNLFKFDLLSQTIVKNVRVLNPQDKARRVEITLQHGRYRRNVILPTLPTSPPGAPAEDGTDAPDAVGPTEEEA